MTAYVFQGATSSWFTATSWLSTDQPPAPGVPGAGDSAEIDSGTADMGNRNDSIAALYLYGGSIIGTATLNAKGGSQLGGGYIGQSLALALHGKSAVTGLHIGGAASLENFGTLSETGNITVGDGSDTGATLINEAGANFNIANAVTINNGASTALFTNAGTISTLAGSGTSAILVSLVNTGTIRIAAKTTLQIGGTTTDISGTITGAGTLSIGDAGSGGSETIEGSAVLDIGTILITGQYPYVVLDGNITYNGTFLVEAASSLFGGNAAPIDLNGYTLSLGGNVTLASNDFEYGAVWFGGGGTLSTTGTTLITAANQALTLSSGTSWSNAGSIVERGDLQLGDATGIGVTFSNLVGGIVDFTASSTIFSFDPTYSFFGNAGLLEVTNATSSNSVQANITNAGTIAAIKGRLSIGTGGASSVNSGLITASGGGEVLVQDGLANAGSITASANSLVWLQSGGALGGTIGGGGGSVYLSGVFSVSSGATQSVTFAKGASFAGVGAGAATLSGAGTIATTGPIAITGNGGTSLLLGNGVTWLNKGTVTDSGQTYFGAAGGDFVTLVNAAGSTFDITAGGALFQNANGGSGEIVNRGNLTADTNGGTSVLSVGVLNSGRITAATGDTLVLGGGALGGTIGGGGGGVVLTGEFDVGAAKTQTVAFATGAGISGAGYGTADLFGAGTLSSSGTIAIAYNGGNALLLGHGMTWLNTGVINDGGQTVFGAVNGDNVALENAAGATLNLTAGGELFYNSNGGGGQIDNNGSLIGSGGSSQIGVYVVNAGTISASAGNILLLTGGVLGGKIGGGGGNVALTGEYDVAAGATQSVVFAAGAGFAAPGQQRALIQGAGTLVSTGTLSINGDGGESLRLYNGVTWQNAGVVNDSGSIAFGNSYGDYVTLINAAGATFNVLSAGDVFYPSSGGSGQIDNNGSLVGSGGNGEIGVYVVNAGTISATAGNTLLLTGGVLGGTIGGGGGAVELTGEYDVASGATQTVNFVAGAALSAIGQQRALIQGAGTLVSTGTLSINNDGGEALRLFNQVTWQNSGVVNDDGVIALGNSGGDSVTLINAAGSSFNIVGDGQVFYDANGGGGAFANNGVLVGMGGNSTMSVYVANAGTVSAAAGNMLTLNGGVGNSAAGTIVASTGGVVEIGNGLANAGTLAALGGTIVLNTSVSGSGGAQIGTNGVLELGGADAQNVAFAGTAATLRLDQPSAFTGAITGLGFSDVLDFAGVSVSSASLQSGVLSVVSNAGTFTYGVSGALTGTNLQLQADGNGGTDLVVGVPGQSFTLTTGTDSFLGGIGNDNFIAATNTLNAGDSLDGAGGTNTLSLNGAGSFNLAAPAALNHITMVQASEVGQTITLRAGTTDMLAVASGTIADTIIGAANSDAITLGTAADKVTIGGAAESIQGSGTGYVLSAAGNAASALINVATGNTSLAVSGGGTIALNAGDNGLATVTLAAASTAYNFTANAEIGLTITDSSAGQDTLSAGGIGEILTGGAAGHLTMIGYTGGGTDFLDTSALLNGDLIKNLATAGSVLDISDLSFSGLSGTFTENASATAGTLHLTDGTHTTTVSLAGSFAAAGFSGSLAAAGFVVSSDGHAGTAISFG